MATNKKAILFYCEWIENFESLSDCEAGILIKHLLRYVNDQDPEYPDRITELSFLPIKQQLKRDLKTWENIKQIRSESGKLGGRPKKQIEAKKANGFIEKQTKAKKAVEVEVEVEVDNTISFNKEIVFNFKKEFLKIGLQEKFINEWLKIRKAKKLVNTETAFKKFLTEFQKTDMEINSLFENYIIPKSWGGFESDWLNKDKKLNGISTNNNSNNKQSERIMQNLATAARLAKKFESEGIAVNPMGK